MAEAEEPRPWVGQDSRARQEREHRYGHGPESEHDRAVPDGPLRRPGSAGERQLQRRLGTSERAERFYEEQVLDHLNERMREFVQRQEMFFLATADASGECDSSFRAGPAGFLQVLGERTLAYPEYRGNGVHASLGNIQENPHLGIMLVDFTRARIGLHINGRATLVDDDQMRASYPHLPEDGVPGRRPQLWVHVEVEEAYIHCAKHIPQLQKATRRTARDWGTDDYKRKGGDFFGTARDAREGLAAGVSGAREHGRPGEPAGEAAPAGASRYGAGDAAESPDSALTPAPVASASADSPYDEPADSTRKEAAPAAPAAAETRSALEAGSGPAATPEVTSASEAAGPTAPTGPTAPDEAPGRRWSAEALGVPGQRRFPGWQLPDVPAEPQQEQTGHTAMDGASGALAARGAQPSFHVSGSDPRAWREEAERALAEAQRRGAMSEAGTFQGWFG